MDEQFGFGREQDVDESVYQRSSPRDSMFLQARVLRPGQTDLALRVRNLSAGGLMAETDYVFLAGEAISVELRTIGIVPAKIAWMRSPRVGIAFDRPIDPKLARKAPPQSPGTGLLLIPKVNASKRPAVRND